MRHGRVAGVVSGSVIMIKAKKKIGRVERGLLKCGERIKDGA